MLDCIEIAESTHGETGQRAGEVSPRAAIAGACYEFPAGASGIGSAAVRTVPRRRGLSEGEPAAEGGHAVVDPDESVAARIGAADPVVAHLEVQHAVLDRRGHRGGSGARVLDDVRERLRDDEVRVGLDLRRQALRRDIHGDRQVEPLDDRVDGAAKPGAREIGGEDPVGQLAQLLVGLLCVLDAPRRRATRPPRRRWRIARCASPRVMTV